MFKSKVFLFILLNFIVISSFFPYTNFFIYNNDEKSESTLNHHQKDGNLTENPSISSNQKISLTRNDIANDVGLTWLLNQGYRGNNINICIVDSGISSSYPQEFGSRIINSSSFVTVENGYASDDPSSTPSISHGTQVASLAAGNIYGMANGSNLIAAKILSSGITGNAGYLGEETSRSVAKGVLFCAEQNATIINLSIGQYSNIVNDGRQYIIDKVSKERNIIFTISAANEGYSGVDGGSIGTPGTSFQAITVAASNGASSMASFSSSGIRSDYTVKPDITAPGSSIQTIAGSGSGTSFSAPIVAGGIAVLLEALTQAGKNYSVGSIKAALLETAKPFDSIPVWYQGAGLVNFTKAYELLVNKPLSNNIPLIVSAFPTKLPLKPLDSIFIDQVTPFNLTIVSSHYDLAIITLYGIPTDCMSFPSNQYFNASERLSLFFHPTINTPVGFHQGFILLEFSLGPVVNVSIEFTVKKPIIKLLFDETKNGFINDKKPGQSNQLKSDLDDPWGDSTFLLGQYREFYNIMSYNNISVTPFLTGSYTNITYLQKFDVIMFPYPNSKIINTFTDWYNDPIYDGNFVLSEDTLLFSQTEFLTLNSYIKDYSTGILILTSDQVFTNTTAFNSLLDAFNIGYELQIDSIYNLKIPISNDSGLFTSITSLDYYGTSFVSKNTNLNTYSFENGKFLALDDLSTSSLDKGRIIVSGSSYFAENYMLNQASNANYQNDCKFVLNILSWLSGFSGNMNSFIIQTTTTTSTLTSIIETTTISQSCNISPSYTISIPSTSSNLSSVTKTTDQTANAFLGSLIIVPVIAFVKRKKRKN
jgi:hypothetical protein